jgi:uncharacterized iron-regulated protein
LYDVKNFHFTDLFYKRFQKGHHRMRKAAFLLLFLFLCVPVPLRAQAPESASAPSQGKDAAEPPYRIFRSTGAPASLIDVISAMAETDVVFIGETHNDPVAHFLEAELLRQAHARYGKNADEKSRRSVALSLEMFERDVQTVMNEYLAGLIPERQFLLCSRPWENYATDYRPMIEYCRENKLPVIAANAPRRYVNMVFRAGRGALMNLSDTGKSWIAPLPYGAASAGYSEKFGQLMGEMPKSPMTSGANHPPAMTQSAVSSQLDAQSLWDATMAHSIVEALNKTPNSLVLQVNGKFHSEERMGIPDHVPAYRKGARMMTVTILPGEGFPNFNAGALGRLGDFVILTDPTVPRTFR